jgi:hypothetical protein
LPHKNESPNAGATVITGGSRRSDHVHRSAPEFFRGK